VSLSINSAGRLVSFLACFFLLNDSANAAPKVSSSTSPSGMVRIPGGEFMMGSDAKSARPDEQPVHRVKLDAFWMDATEVTNADFRRFVEETGYVTTAEKPPKLEDIMAQLPPGSPPPPAESLKPGSLVFTSPKAPGEYWWKWVDGANWRHPQGPLSTVEGLDNHPVVQVSWDDAVAYAKWAGKRLPTVSNGFEKFPRESVQ